MLLGRAIVRPTPDRRRACSANPILIALPPSPTLIASPEATPMGIPKKTEERIRSALKRFAPVLQAQRDRDVSEADTVTLVKDLFSELLGFDKYAELTSEHQIRSTFCDLAVRLEDKLRLLVEVKAIGIALNDRHVKQAVDYAANQGVDFVVLTNAIQWRLYQVVFKKPIDSRLITEFDLLSLDAKSDAALELVYLLSREGMLKGAIQEFSERKQATSRFILASLLVNDEDVVNAIRRELRKITDMLVAPETIVQVLRQEVIKREAFEGEEAAEAERVVRRHAKAAARVAKAAVPGEVSTPIADLEKETTPG